MPGLARVCAVVAIGFLLSFVPAMFPVPYPGGPGPMASAEAVHTQASPPPGQPTPPPQSGQPPTPLPPSAGVPDRQRVVIGTAGIVLIALVLGSRRLRGKTASPIQLKWKKGQ